MKNVHILSSVFLAAALVAAGAVTSCTNEDNAVVENPSDNEILFTAPLAPKGGDGATRAVYVDGTTAWVDGEQIAIYYQTGENSFALTTATVDASDTDGSATFSATLTGAMNGTKAKFIYPASLAKDNGEINISRLKSNQKGTLDDLSANFDAATVEAELVVSSTSATVSDPVSMKNELCICHFTFSGMTFDSDVNSMDVYITATENGESLTYSLRNLVPASPAELYVAMLPTTSADFTFKVQGWHTEGQDGTVKNKYEAPATGVKLDAGTFYKNVPIYVGQIISKSGAINETITIPDGGTLYLNGAKIKASSGPGILCEGDAYIVLTGENTVTTTYSGQAGIQAGTSLTISGSGSLTATGGSDSSGIGAGYRATCGDITISGSTVTAIGGGNGSGIGTGEQGTCGNITIIGGTVTATGGHFSAGIGDGYKGRCGAITISGDNTHIKSTKGDDAHYSIGKGVSTSTCGTVTIGGTVYYNGFSFVNDGESYLATSPFYWQWPTP